MTVSKKNRSHVRLRSQTHDVLANMLAMRIARAALLVVLPVGVSVAHAEPPSPIPMPEHMSEATAERCAATFETRLADARQSVLERQEYMAVYERYVPWFREHCRWLSDLEIAVRKLDDEHAFVCDTTKGRPSGLTAQVVLEHQSPVDAHVLQEHANANTFCERFDKAERVSLVLTRSDSAEGLAKEIGVMCWANETAKCAKARAALAAAAKK